MPLSVNYIDLFHEILAKTRLLGPVLCGLLVWRFWRFTVQPWLYADRPKELPYWIPGIETQQRGIHELVHKADHGHFIVLGHGRAFFQDCNALLRRARSYFGNSAEPFALTAFGMKFYVITQAKQSLEMYRNSEDLSFVDFVQDLMRTNGNDKEAIKTMYMDLPVDKPGFPNPRGESLGILAQKMHAHQLHPGQNLLVLQKEVQKWLNCHMNLKDICAIPSASSPNVNSVEVLLYRWCSEYFTLLGQDIFFGGTLAKIDPTLPSTFLVFDELIWKMLYKYPDILSSDMSTARSQVIASLKEYFQTPQSQRTSDTTWLVTTLENEIKVLGLDDRNLAVIAFHLYIAINTNARKAAFWMLTYLLYNPELLATYRDDTAPAFRGTELVDPFMLQDALACPEVDAIWHETLRISGWATSIRLVKKDTIIGNKLMRKGNHVMVPHRLMHFDEDEFGEAIHQFRTDRWLNNKSLPRSPSFRPFGGGKGMCSGRFFSRFSVTAFVATILHRFDVELVGKPRFPRADEGRPVLGIMCIMEGDDYTVRLTPKADFA